MKKLVAACLLLCLLVLCGCPANNGQTTGKPPNNQSTDEVNEVYFYVEGNKLTVALQQNAATAALVQLLQEGDISFEAADYGGFEKVGSLGHTLPTQNSQMTATAGDVVLYAGNQIVVFYGSNSWSYTKLGTVQGLTQQQLAEALHAGQGNVTIRISLT